MRKTMFLLISAAMIISLWSCSNDGSGGIGGFMSNVSGMSGEIILVVDKYIWDGPEGRRLEKIFQSDAPGLPQPEPMFNIISVSPSSFGRLYQNHRNIVIISADPSLEENTISFQKDRYAHTQVIIKAAGPEISGVIDEIEARKQAVFNTILKAERERWMSYYKKTQSIHNFNILKDQHRIIMPVPAGYTVDVNRQGFAWVSQETPLTTQSVLLHYFKASGSSVFSRDSMIMIRNRLTRKEVEGPVEGTYMAIEDIYPPRYRVFNYNGRNYAELRGLWTLKNGFMGGPFVTLMTYDEKNMRAVMLDGFVYAPNENKRELMRQVEALLYTAEFYSPEEVVVKGSK